MFKDKYNWEKNSELNDVTIKPSKNNTKSISSLRRN